MNSLAFIELYSAVKRYKETAQNYKDFQVTALEDLYKLSNEDLIKEYAAFRREVNLMHKETSEIFDKISDVLSKLG